MMKSIIKDTCVIVASAFISGGSVVMAKRQFNIANEDEKRGEHGEAVADYALSALYVANATTYSCIIIKKAMESLFRSL